jgi:hypothetical protein
LGFFFKDFSDLAHHRELNISLGAGYVPATEQAWINAASIGVFTPGALR